MPTKYELVINIKTVKGLASNAIIPARPRRRGDRVKRREFITLLGGAAVTWPLAVRAEQMTEIGFLGSGTDLSERHLFTAFQEGLAEVGFVVGQNISIEHRVAEGRYDSLPGMATEFVSRKVAIIAASGSFGCTCG